MAVWTSPEDKILLNLYETAPREEILSKLPHRDWRSVYKRSVILKLFRPRDDMWTKEEKELLKKYYPDTPKDVLMNYFPGRSWKAIAWQALNVLRLKRTEEITKAETIKTNQAKLGVDYPTQSKKVRDKVKETVQEKYGVDNVFQSEKIKKKITKTNIKKYGVSSPQKSKEIKKKTIATNLKKYKIENTFQLVDKVQKGMQEKYGYKSPQQVPEIRKSTEQTNIERYGHKIPSLNPDIKEKIEKTNIEKFGFKTPFKNEDIKSKIKDTVKIKYGVENPAQHEGIKRKTWNTCLKKYGVKSLLCLKEIRDKGHKTIKDNKLSQRSKGEISFINYLKIFDTETDFQIEHPDTGYIIDFYMPKYDLWVQYDGIYWHGKTKRKNTSAHSKKISATIKRDLIQNKNIPNLIRLWSDDIEEAIKKGNILEYLKNKIIEKLKYNLSINPVCHQYKKKIEWYEEDIKNLSFNPDSLKATNFSLFKEAITPEIIGFIEKYEWLGTIGVIPKWCFTARYMGILGGVVLINEPTAYSKLLGEKTIVYEALIQRGATASWTPRNLGSRLIMFACRWMVHNTEKRAFICYGDPAANELGIIYQSCNFEYLGNSFGNTSLYRHPKFNNGKTFSSQALKRTSSFKKWCKENNIVLQKEWIKENGFKNINKIPMNIKEEWFSWIKNKLSESTKIPVDKKHKYIKVLGKDKREERFLNSQKNYKALPYPKN